MGRSAVAVGSSPGMTGVGITSWVSGRLVAPLEPVIRSEDRGLVGDGVFEALRVVDGVPFAKRRHLQRLLASAAPLGIQVDLDQIDAGIAAVTATEQVRSQPSWLRITVTGGAAPMGKGERGAEPTVVVAAAALPQWPAPSRTVTLPWCRNERGALAGLKTLSYLENGVALRYAMEHGADEGIFANTSGQLCEGAGSNAFVVVDGEIVTPPLSSGCLDGITRQLLLEWMPEITVSDLPIDVLGECEEAFLTSTSRTVHPVASIDGRPLATVNGERTAAVRACYADRSAADPDP